MAIKKSAAVKKSSAAKKAAAAGKKQVLPVSKAPATTAGKKLIIAEKPSVANDIARVLGGFTRHGIISKATSTSYRPQWATC